MHREKELEEEILTLKAEVKGLRRVIRDLVDLLKEKHLKPKDLEKIEEKQE